MLTAVELRVDRKYVTLCLLVLWLAGTSRQSSLESQRMGVCTCNSFSLAGKWWIIDFWVFSSRLFDWGNHTHMIDHWWCSSIFGVVCTIIDHQLIYWELFEFVIWFCWWRSGHHRGHGPQAHKYTVRAKHDQNKNTEKQFCLLVLNQRLDFVP